jgi:SET domain-containing protein
MKVIVKIRQDNERGLFATHDIKKGEYICILPIDYFQLDNRWYTTNSVTYDQIDKINFRYGILCEISKIKDTQYESFSSFLNGSKRKCITCFWKKTEIVGVSNPDKTDFPFVGHIINDYVDMSFLSENKYEKMSKEFSNVKVSSKLQILDHNRLGLKIKATKDIESGTELYLSYGSEYWKTYSGKQRFVYNIKISTIG